MVYLKTVMEVMIALFAVIGIYCVARLFAQKHYGSKRLFLAVDLTDGVSAEEAELRIQEGLSQFMLVPSGNLMVLVTEEGKNREDFQHLWREYAIEDCLLVISGK